MTDTAWAEDVADSQKEAANEEKPRVSLRGNKRQSSRGWRSGYCQAGNDSFCVGWVRNGAAVGGDLVLCVCDCHKDQHIES